MKLSNLIALPFVFGAAVCLFLIYQVDDTYSWYLIPFVVALAIIYMLSPQIDWWWYTKHPPSIDDRLKALFLKHRPYYSNLSSTEKKRFEERVALYMKANSFVAKGLEEDGEPPEDIIGFIAANVVQLTFGQEDYRFPSFERIVIYPNRFPSPQFPEHIHASEIFEEDGVIIYGVKPLMASILNPSKTFNIGLYEYVKIFMLSYPNKNYPKLDDDIWMQIEAIGGLSKKQVHDFIGLPDIDPLPVSICLFFDYPEKFKTILPEVYGQLVDVFNQDPLRKDNPVIVKPMANVH